MKHCLSIALMLLMVGISTNAFCGDTEGLGSPFNLGTGARELALGGAAIADPAPSTSAYWSAASLARTPRISMSTFYTRLFEAGVAYQYVGFALPTLDYGAFGVGIFRLGVDGIEIRDDKNFLSGETSESRLGAYLGYGRHFSGFDLGVTVNIEHQSLDSYSSTSSPGIGLSIGRQLDLRESWLNEVSVAVTARNLLEPSLKLADESSGIPTSVDIGASAKILPNDGGEHTISLYGSVSKAKGVDPEPNLGLEFAMHDMLFLRGGLSGNNLSAGIGVKYGLFGFDYAMLERDMDNLHTVSMSLDFGKSVFERRVLRETRREAEFDTLMSQRLNAKNTDMIHSLAERGEHLVNNDSIAAAYPVLDKALFLARSMNQDTTAIQRLLSDVKTHLDKTSRKEQLERHLDSAQVKLNSGDLLLARYFTNLAIEIEPTSGEAVELADTIETLLTERQVTDQLVNDILARSDSLLSYGMVEEAENELKGIRHLSQSDSRVKKMSNKVAFAIWKEAASVALSHGLYGAASAALDSAEMVHPQHPWISDYRRRVKRESDLARRAEAVPKVNEQESVSPELMSEVESAYKDGQVFFEGGDLPNSIVKWEKVERLAPAYKSVREYLVKAYKYVGVEYYSENRLSDAVAIWKKAALLDPENSEINGYIKRTETEISQIEELTYDHR